MITRPALGSSSPAIMRKSVDLPQPDGPTSTRNSPSSIVRSVGESATPSPKRLASPTISTLATRLSPLSTETLAERNDAR